MLLMKHPIHGKHYAQGNEEADMRKNGWVEDAPEVIPAVAHAPVEAPKPDRHALERAAAAKHIKVDQRWSNDRLAAEIEKA